MCFHELFRVASKAVFISTRDENPSSRDGFTPINLSLGEGKFLAFLDRLINVQYCVYSKKNSNMKTVEKVDTTNPKKVQTGLEEV